MGHIFGLTHASSTSTSVMYYNNAKVRRNLTCCDSLTFSEFYNPEYSITVQNNFNDGSDYVNIYNSQNNKSVKSAPYLHEERESTWPWDMEAENQNFTEGSKTYYIQFDEWLGYDFQNAGLERQDIPMVDDGNFTANFYKTFNITFTNKYGTSGTGGLISVNSSQVNSPTSNYEVTQYNTINTVAVSQTIDGIYFTFSSWTKDGGQTIPPSELTSSAPPFIPTDHTTYECNLTGRPTNTYRSLHFNDEEPGEEVEVMWSKHPLDDEEVTEYAIWRKIRYNGVTGDPVKIHTKTADGSSTYTYTDTGYMISDGYNGYIYYYDVKAYYAPDLTYSNDDYVAVYAEAEPNIQTEDLYQSTTGEAAEEIPLEYALENYPNPFNPTTTIRFSLAESGFVTIKIYDMLGKEISTLVNEERPAGIYNTEFNASNLPSGVYIYSIVTNNFKQSRKMILTK